MYFANGSVFGPRGKLSTQDPRHPQCRELPLGPSVALLISPAQPKPSSRHKAVEVRWAGAPEAALRPPSANLAGPWNPSPSSDNILESISGLCF